MKEGDIAVVCGLRNAAQWNGHVGAVVRKLGDDRWVVLLEESGKVKHRDCLMDFVFGLFSQLNFSEFHRNFR